MPSVPAVCDTCHALFPSGFFVEGVVTTTFVGNRAGPCPKCGGMGHIPDGLYRFTERAIELLAGPAESVDEIRRLAEMIRRAQSTGQTPETLTRELQSDPSGVGAKLAKLTLPTNPAEFWAFMAVLVMVLLARCAPGDAPSQTNITNNIIESAYYTAPGQTAAPAATRASHETPKRAAPPARKLGRNDPCPCGSGLKSRKCHGK